jgi:site-specific recombinase XerD
MPKHNLAGHWVRRFLGEYIIGERNFSRHTLTSYRDTIALLLPFAAKSNKVRVDRLTVDGVGPNVIRSFLLHLEKDRKNSPSTRNQRLAAIHAFARFVGESCPEYVLWSSSVSAIPFKKTGRPTVDYLEKDEMDALLDAPDQSKKMGRRDYAILLLLYNSGARASELTTLSISDLTLTGTFPSVKIFGKGRKIRNCPLWALTVKKLSENFAAQLPNETAFINCRGQPMTRFGLHSLIRRYTKMAEKKVPSLKKKRVSPHTIRHTTAVHLLRSGVDINTIRAWLGHVSLDTTQIYAEVDLEMKSKALAHCEIMQGRSRKKRWHNRETMGFLKAL